LDKTLTQFMIVTITLLLAASLIPTLASYSLANSPSSAASEYATAQSGAQRIGAQIMSLVASSQNGSTFVTSTDPSTLNGWVCRNLEHTPWGIFSTGCGSTSYTQNSVQRSFVTSVFSYYTVMTYIPKGASPFNLQLNWWFNVKQPAGYLNFGVQILKGDETQTGTIPWSVQEAYVFYWTGFYWGGYRSGSAQIQVSGDETVALSMEIVPSYTSQISFGANGLTQSFSSTNLTVILPSSSFQAELVSPQTGELGPEKGPTAQFNLSVFKSIKATLNILYDSVTVATYNSNFTNGETIRYLPQPEYAGSPSTTLIFNTPITLTTHTDMLTVYYGETNYTFWVPAQLIGQGTSQVWLITAVGCQKTCYVSLQPLTGQVPS
jgi:hypothetical protein